MTQMGLLFHVGLILVGMFSAMWIGFSSRTSPADNQVNSQPQSHSAIRPRHQVKFPSSLMEQESKGDKPTYMPSDNPTPNPTEMPTAIPSMLGAEEDDESNPRPSPMKEVADHNPTTLPTEMPTTVPAEMPGTIAEEEEARDEQTLAPTELPTTVPSWYSEQEEENQKRTSSPIEVPSRKDILNRNFKYLLSEQRNLAADVALPDDSVMEIQQPELDAGSGAGYISFLSQEMEKYGASLMGARWFLIGLFWTLGFLATAAVVLVSTSSKGNVDVDTKIVSLKPIAIQAPDPKPTPVLQELVQELRLKQDLSSGVPLEINL
jgi:hypothetical protein